MNNELQYGVQNIEINRGRWPEGTAFSTAMGARQHIESSDLYTIAHVAS
jgi:hypothetical protein